MKTDMKGRKIKIRRGTEKKVKKTEINNFLQQEGNERGTGENEAGNE